MSFLTNKCLLSPYTEDVRNACLPFSCGSKDMDEFFHKDFADYAHYLMGKSYCFRQKENLNQIVCAFTISNDSIRIYDLPRSRRDYMQAITHHEKHLRRYPGVLIGRLAVAEEFARLGIGSEVLTFIKDLFSDPAIQTGCRFVIVDAVNSPEILSFYRKNGFVFLFSTEEQETLYTFPPKDKEEIQAMKNNLRPLQTRLMYFDLLDLKDNIPSPPEVL